MRTHVYLDTTHSQGDGNGGNLWQHHLLFTKSAKEPQDTICMVKRKKYIFLTSHKLKVWS